MGYRRTQTHSHPALSRMHPAQRLLSGQLPWHDQRHGESDDKDWFRDIDILFLDTCELATLPALYASFSEQEVQHKHNANSVRRLPLASCCKRIHSALCWKQVVVIHSHHKLYAGWWNQIDFVNSGFAFESNHRISLSLHCFAFLFAGILCHQWRNISLLRRTCTFLFRERFPVILATIWKNVRLSSFDRIPN